MRVCRRRRDVGFKRKWRGYWAGERGMLCLISVFGTGKRGIGGGCGLMGGVGGGEFSLLALLVGVVRGEFLFSLERFSEDGCEVVE